MIATLRGGVSYQLSSRNGGKMPAGLTKRPYNIYFTYIIYHQELNMASRQLTQVYLDAEQKAALQKRAKEKGSKVAEEIRNAVDTYLTGVTPEELELLDIASREAAKEFDAMSKTLEATNKKLDRVFRELEKIRAEKDKAA
jgi:BMFP domain-containing protein YqiC